jgi:uncharacterized protein (TIGR02147 family)
MRDHSGQDDYRALLRRELAARSNANPRYSQRAFARDLRLRPNRLSEILNGKQGLSRASALAVAQRLGWSAGERERFCDLVDSRHARSPARRIEAQERVRKGATSPKQHVLADEIFQAIADWQHLAILELTTTRGFRADPAWIARRLAMPRAVAKGALERLERLGLVVRRGGELAAANEVDIAPGGVPSAAVRRFHAQVLEKAERALATQSVDEREVATAFIAVPADRYAEAAQAVQAFVRDFSQRFGAAGADELFSLGVQLFRLTEADPRSRSDK